MTAADLYRRVEARLPDAIEVDGKTITHEVLAALAERLKPDEAVELGAELPDELGDVLAQAHGDGNLTRDELIEDIASRLDLDDDDAELGAQAVLGVIREALEPVVEIEQVLESLPADLASLMQ
ncbi:MAG TPA: DUF2267 domain-containing protein [Polyangia bacterium]|jgi:uncharacterized protein (DUF2267 family)